MEAIDMVMEVEDDDVFFADLNRQISLLITEDDDDEGDYYTTSKISSDYYPTAVSIHPIHQAFSRQQQLLLLLQQSQYQFDHLHTGRSTYKTTTTADHQSKGTGVFIPKSSPQFTKRRTSKHQRKETKHVSYYYNNSYKTNNNNYKSSSSSSYSYNNQLQSRGVFATFLTSDTKECLDVKQH